ncbi:MAG: hypothetical protein IPM18_15640 [Phycisphaerales bacterium]|nr:hypothetical protein [Phycisphaerales bacterium]
MAHQQLTALAAVLGLLATLPACTRESVRIALDTQRRADDIQHAVFERQHDGLRILLFRDLARRLEAGGERLSPEQFAALNDAWNERDLVEFWALQHERAQALRIAGVDAQLAAQQSIVDLLWKNLMAKVDRARAAAAAYAGRSLVTAPDAENERIMP